MIDRERIWSSSQLPTLPSVAVRLLELSRKPGVEIQEVAECIKSDPAISAKILKATNSAYYGFQARITSVDRAVTLLGTTSVTSLALSFSLADAAMSSGALARHYRDYWRRSLVQATVAEMLEDNPRGEQDCDNFLGGLLTDLGQLAMLKTIGEEYQPVLETVHDQRRELHEVEQEVLGLDHVEVGVKLMENWALPEALVEAVRWHHAPIADLTVRDEGRSDDLINAVATASAAGDYFCTSGKGPALQRLQQLTTAFYGFSEPKLEQFLETARDRIDATGDLFSINMQQLGSPGDLMAQANEHLAELAMRAHMAGAQAAARQQAVEREKQELEVRTQELEQKAARDPLTGLYNRQYFDGALEGEVDRCSQVARPVGILFADIDYFKRLNDTYGHQLGDRVLQTVADGLRETVRDCDIVARYGGEEFVLLIHEPTERSLKNLADQVRKCVGSCEIIHHESRIPVTVSVGAALAVPGRQEKALRERLVAAADEAMYEAKRRGRNRVRFRSLLDEKVRRIMQKVDERRFSRWLSDRNILDAAALYKGLLNCKGDRRRIGLLAQQQGYLTEAQIERVLTEQEESGDRFGATAIWLNWLSEEQLVYLLVLQRENPLLLSRALASLRLLSEDKANALLREYLTETAPKRPSRQSAGDASPRAAASAAQ